MERIMKKSREKWKKKLGVSAALLAAFALFTAAVRCVDVRAIGPQGSSVGFAGINGFVHGLTGVHVALYAITDWLGLIPFAVCAGFGVMGLSQWIRRRSLLKVDRDILFLGAFYIAVIAVYLLFEVCVVNYRPVLIEGRLEASYPSSTTMLTLSVMLTARMQAFARIRRGGLSACVAFLIDGFTAFMVLGRLVSGVHWFTDIVGGALLSAGLAALYAAVSSK